jgi:hypothetical protein
VFFDALGWEYQYEPEGFDLGDAGYYLPDFYLPNEGWFEVKPKDLTEREFDKLHAFALHADCMVHALIGSPWATFDQADYYVLAGWRFGDPSDLIIDWTHDAWIQCRRCDNIGLESFSFQPWHYPPEWDREGGHYGFCHSEHPGIGWGERLTKAFAAARQARFEHGETPQRGDVRSVVGQGDG